MNDSEAKRAAELKELAQKVQDRIMAYMMTTPEYQRAVHEIMDRLIMEKSTNLNYVDILLTQNQSSAQPDERDSRKGEGEEG